MTGADQAPTLRKPRIALMGEFSAGKSTLSNLLLGARPLPESVTATRLSPVWISQGQPGAVRERLDGALEPVSLADLHLVPIDDTRVIRLNIQSELLDSCDLIDCPGISDPNMPSEVWERLVPEIDGVLWCTHATQAWRQSEAAVWEGIPDDIRQRSLLLITRFDKLTTERDQHRVLSRVQKETQGLFSGIFPMSLLRALAAGDDAQEWEASGADAFAQRLMGLIQDMRAEIAGGRASGVTPRRPAPVTAGGAARPAAADLESLDVAPSGRGSLFDMAASEPTKAPEPARAASARPAAPNPRELEEEIPTENAPSALDALAEIKSAMSDLSGEGPTEEPSLDELMGKSGVRTLSDALSLSSGGERPNKVRALTLRKNRPVPNEDELTATADAVGSVLPRRVARPEGTKTERPRRERPAKNPGLGIQKAPTESSLTDLRNAFSGE